MLGGQLTGPGLLQLACPGDALESEHTTSPVLADLLVALVEVVLDRFGQLVQRDAVVALDGGQGDAGAGLATHQHSQAALALDDDVWHAHLAAQSGQVQHQLKDKQAIGQSQYTQPSTDIIQREFALSGVNLSTRHGPGVPGRFR